MYDLDGDGKITRVEMLEIIEVSDDPIIPPSFTGRVCFQMRTEAISGENGSAAEFMAKEAPTKGPVSWSPLYLVPRAAAQFGLGVAGGDAASEAQRLLPSLLLALVTWRHMNQVLERCLGISMCRGVILHTKSKAVLIGGGR